jgi:hypothetical protein
VSGVAQRIDASLNSGESGRDCGWSARGDERSTENAGAVGCQSIIWRRYIVRSPMNTSSDR